MLFNIVRYLTHSKNLYLKKNLIKIELVPPKIHKHLFESNDKNDSINYDSNIASCSGEGLKNFDSETINEVLNHIELPQLRVYGNLMAHFDALGKEQFNKYRELLELAANIKTIPKMPIEWCFRTGWTAYDPITNEAYSIDYPNENVLFFDVEVCVQDGQLPTLAVGLSLTKWYSWCSDRLVNLSEYPKFPTLKHLIPLECSIDNFSLNNLTEKVIIGHNIAYDRSRVAEQYLQKKTLARFWDTMSMSISICGMADHQRLMFERSDSATVNEEEWLEEWRLRVCKNSLEAVHAKFCNESSTILTKQYQDSFLKENIEKIRDNFQILINYCATDVLATYEVYRALYPDFKERFPSQITYCGMMEMASAYLPINSNWRSFFEKCEKSVAVISDNSARQIVESAKSIANLLDKNYESDPWMWVSDWRKSRDSNIPAWFQNFFKKKKFAEDDLIDELISDNIRLLNRDIPRLFGLCFGPYPLFFKNDYGWGFLVPNKDILISNDWPDKEKVRLKKGNEVILNNRAILNLIERNKSKAVPSVMLRNKPVAKLGIFDYYQLPHPNGSTENVGTPFSKHYRINFEQKQFWAYRFENILTDFLNSRSSTRFWANYRERYNEQLAIWLDNDANIGAISPSIIPAGTVTRRAVHKLWLVSTNAKEGMIGSDLKSMIQCSDNWCFVGADVDSQEQWIAALFGDCAYGTKHAGSTQFSNMLLAGDKSKGTDLHSVIAKEAKITRDHAKILNYARLYGSGKAHAVDFLKQQGVSEFMAFKISDKLFNTTKGTAVMCYELNPNLNEQYEYFLKFVCRPEYVARQSILVNNRHFLPVYCKLSGELSRIFEKWILSQIRNDLNFKNISNQITNPQELYLYIYCNYPQQIQLYRNGFESHTFNYLEVKSYDLEPKTPILDCRLSRALEPISKFNTPKGLSFSRKYKRSIINWFVQSSAVDFLHMLLVCMNWLCSEYEIEARFVISIHDELRYLVKEEDRYRCALALLLSNMYTRSAISSKLGINELPLSVAFFTKVDIDKILRKEVDTICYNPSGELIPNGEGLSIKEIIKKTGGTLRKKKRES